MVIRETRIAIYFCSVEIAKSNIYIYIYDREIRNGRIKIQANSLDRARLSPAGDSRGSGDLLVTVDTERSLLRVGGRSSFPA